MKRNRQQRGADWYVIDGKLIRLEKKPGIIEWSAANRVRAVAAVVMIVVLIAAGVHAWFIGWDKQIALNDEKNIQQWGDFYAAQEDCYENR